MGERQSEPYRDTSQDDPNQPKFNGEVVRQGSPGVSNQASTGVVKSTDMPAIGSVGTNTGIQLVPTSGNAGGISGFFGGEKEYPLVTTGIQNDPNYAVNRAHMRMGAANIGNRALYGTGAAPTIDQSPQAQFRAQQMALAQQLQARAAGTGGPSPAELQFNRATDRSMNQALSMALSARGGNQMAALRQAGDQRALIAQEAAVDAATLRSNEQQAAQQQLAQLSATGRGADIGLASGQAQLTQQGQIANLNASIQQQAQKDELLRFYLQQGLTLDQANYQASVQQAQYNQGSLAQQIAAANGVSVQNAAQGMQVGGAAIGALGSLAAAAISDEREKTDISDGQKDLVEMLTKVGTHKYRYKNPDKPGAGEGEFVSPMAQELEQSKIGRSMVKTQPDGTKMVDYGKGFGALLSALSMQQKRLDRMEAHA